MTRPVDLVLNASVPDPDLPAHKTSTVSSSDTAMTVPRIGTLDGWRTLCVSLVIISHLLTKSTIKLDYNEYGFIETWGTIGVRIFFVISGFVICRGLLQEFNKTNYISVAAFYVRRIFRIVPMLWLYLISVFILASYGLIVFDNSLIYKSVLFTCNIGTQGCGGFPAGHMWSLAIEEQFYAIFPLMFFAMIKYIKRSVKFLFLFFPIFILALLFFHKYDVAEFLSAYVYINAGVVLALCEKAVLHRKQKFGSTLAILIFITILAVDPFMNPGKFNTVFLLVIEPFLMVLMLVSTINSQSLFTKFLSLNFMVAIGRASYGIYLWQQLATYPYEDAGIAFYISSVAGTILLCLLSFRYIEKSIIKFGSRLSDRILSKRMPVMAN